ncbi:hypothetical protein Fmac_018005 [Flemingia macrophylla]|uniref:Uncharacterized protein n=1 Tax=Flemingia macrophylla TaxID=520843 RepID=A0ABD1M3Q1_9FABA
MLQLIQSYSTNKVLIVCNVVEIRSYMWDFLQAMMDEHSNLPTNHPSNQLDKAKAFEERSSI